MKKIVLGILFLVSLPAFSYKEIISEYKACEFTATSNLKEVLFWGHTIPVYSTDHNKIIGEKFAPQHLSIRTNEGLKDFVMPGESYESHFFSTYRSMLVNKSEVARLSYSDDIKIDDKEFKGTITIRSKIGNYKPYQNQEIEITCKRKS